MKKIIIITFALLVSVCAWGQHQDAEIKAILERLEKFEKQEPSVEISWNTDDIEFALDCRTIEQGSLLYDKIDMFSKECPSAYKFTVIFKSKFEYKKTDIENEFSRMIENDYILSLLTETQSFIQYRTCKQGYFIEHCFSEGCGTAVESLENALELVKEYCELTGNTLNTTKMEYRLSAYKRQLKLIEDIERHYDYQYKKLLGEKRKEKAEATGLFD